MQHWGWTIHYLKKHRLESILIVLTMGVGVAVLTTVLTVYLGFTHQLKDYLDDEHYRLFTVTDQNVKKVPSFRLAPPIQLDMDWIGPSLVVNHADLKQIKENLPVGMSVFPLIEKTFRIDHPRQIELKVVATDVGFNQFYRFSLLSGAWFVDDDVREGSPVIILSLEAAEHLFGTEDPLGKKTFFENTPESSRYTVIGVMDKSETDIGQGGLGVQRFAAYVPFGDPLFLDFSLSSFFVGIDLGMDATKALEQIRGVIDLHFEGEAYVTSNLLELQEDLSSVTPILKNVGLFASVGLVIAIVNILNLMLARVLRRIKYGGIHMALGSSRSKVFFQFLGEALLLGLISSGLGMAISHFTDLWLRNTWNMALPTAPFLNRFLISISIGLVASAVFGAYPAAQIARFDLGQALRSEVGGV